MKAFYKAVVKTMLTKFSFNDELVEDVVILLPENRSKVTVPAVFRSAKRFSVVVPEDKFDALEAEVLDYSMAPELPSEPRDEGKPTNSAELWGNIGILKTLEGTDRFLYLVRLAKCILALPHSNADTERVFSIVRKIVTDYRTELDQSTLCAPVACKMNCDDKCFQVDIPRELLDKA